jgi:hypothetical protein
VFGVAGNYRSQGFCIFTETLRTKKQNEMCALAVFQNFVGVVPCKFLRKSIKHLTLLFCVASFPPHYGRVTCVMQVLPTLGHSTVWNASVGTVNQLQRRCSRIPSVACPAQVCKINILFPSVPDPPDPHVFGPPGYGSISQVWIQILLSPSKNCKKNLDSYCFVNSFGLIIFEK